MLEGRNIPADGLATLAQLMCGQTLTSVLPCKQEKLKIKPRTDDERRINIIKPSIMTNNQDH